MNQSSLDFALHKSIMITKQGFVLGGVRRMQPIAVSGSEMNIFVGNLNGEVTNDLIRVLFAPFGEVSKVALMHDRHGISKGFAFVEMPVEDEAVSAIEKLNRTLFLDRTLDISQSAPPPRKGSRVNVKSRPARFKR